MNCEIKRGHKVTNPIDRSKVRWGKTKILSVHTGQEGYLVKIENENRAEEADVYYDFPNCPQTKAGDFKLGQRFNYKYAAEEAFEVIEY